MTREEILKAEILEKYKSLRQFAAEIKIAPSTLTTILNNGIGGTSIDTMLLICEKLNLDINMFREDNTKTEFFTSKEKEMIHLYRKLNNNGKEKAEDYINDLVSNPNYYRDNKIIPLPEQNDNKTPEHLIMKIAGDDGSYEERHITPEELEKIKEDLDKYPDLKELLGL